MLDRGDVVIITFSGGTHPCGAVAVCSSETDAGVSSSMLLVVASVLYLGARDDFKQAIINTLVYIFTSLFRIHEGAPWIQEVIHIMILLAAPQTGGSSISVLVLTLVFSSVVGF